jgi:hypothetical protein
MTALLNGQQLREPSCKAATSGQQSRMIPEPMPYLPEEAGKITE